MWRRSQATVEQKRKYRAYIQGYRKFKTRCTATDEDIEEHVHKGKQGIKDTFFTTSEHCHSDLSTASNAANLEQREMGQLIELLQEGGVG